LAEVWTPPTLNEITTGPLVPAAYLNKLGNSIRFLQRVDWEEVASDLSVTATSAATAGTVCNVGGTLEAVPHQVTFSCARVHNPAGAAVVTHMNLWKDTTDLGIWGSFRSSATGDTSGTPVYLSYVDTPTAAAHTYTLKVWRVTANTTLNAAAGTYMPMQMQLFRLPT
jgi:hypothetical protein